ncbi:MAG: T9SS type A sorting domain-containing protein [Candidatus Hydrothermae bacterium]|nr:T9SS type A sorting domain-containing protein [Candidatus Hydrothermae bacterium]
MELTVYNAAGMRVKTLVNGKVEAGIHKVTWEGTDARGTTVPQGVYFFRLETGNTSLSRKCILMK